MARKKSKAKDKALITERKKLRKVAVKKILEQNPYRYFTQAEMNNLLAGKGV